MLSMCVKGLPQFFFSLLHKMYDNIASLRFDVDSNGETVAGALVSAEGELMELRKPVPVEGRVEEWMTGVLQEMRRTNRLITKEAIFYYCIDKSRCVYRRLAQEVKWVFCPHCVQLIIFHSHVSQDGLDAAVPGHGGAGCQSSVVDLGGRGRL